MAILSQVSQVDGEQAHLLQPIDIWTLRAASRLSLASGKQTSVFPYYARDSLETQTALATQLTLFAIAEVRGFYPI
jgi:hypothetical protein